MPKLLLSNAQKGWPLFQRLLVALFKFMEPYLRNADLSDPVSAFFCLLAAFDGLVCGERNFK